MQQTRPTIDGKAKSLHPSFLKQANNAIIATHAKTDGNKVKEPLQYVTVTMLAAISKAARVTSNNLNCRINAPILTT